LRETRDGVVDRVRTVELIGRTVQPTSIVAADIQDLRVAALETLVGGVLDPAVRYNVAKNGSAIFRLECPESVRFFSRRQASQRAFACAACRNAALEIGARALSYTQS